MATATDPRVMELLRRKKLQTPVNTPTPANKEGTRCGACSGMIAVNGVCRRCYPELAAKPAAEKVEAEVSVPERPSIEAKRAEIAEKDAEYRNANARDIAAGHMNQHTGTPLLPHRSRAGMTTCPKCGGRINTFSNRCPRCPDEVVPTRADIKPITPRPVELAPVPIPSCVELPNRTGVTDVYMQRVKVAILAIQARGEYPSTNKIGMEIDSKSCNSIIAARDRLVAAGEVTIGMSINDPRRAKTVKEKSAVKRIDYPVEVKAAVDAIQARGEYPSTKRIRDEMGHGDPQTITNEVKRMKASGEVVIADYAPTAPPNLLSRKPAQKHESTAATPDDPDRAATVEYIVQRATSNATTGVIPKPLPIIPEFVPPLDEEPVPEPTADIESEFAVIRRMLALSPAARRRVVAYVREF